MQRKGQGKRNEREREVEEIEREGRKVVESERKYYTKEVVIERRKEGKMVKNKQRWKKCMRKAEKQREEKSSLEYYATAASGGFIFFISASPYVSLSTLMEANIILMSLSQWTNIRRIIIHLDMVPGGMMVLVCRVASSTTTGFH